MLLCMRTTLNLDDKLFREVKRIAADTHRTLTSIIEDAIRELLARRAQTRKAPRAKLPVFHGRGLRPGVDLDNAAALLDLMEGRE